MIEGQVLNDPFFRPLRVVPKMIIQEMTSCVSMNHFFSVDDLVRTGRKDDFLLAKKYEIHLCRLVFTGVHHSKVGLLRVAITTKTLRFSFR